MRNVRYKRLECCWSVSGPEKIKIAYVFEVPGYDKLWATITSAADLSAGQTGGQRRTLSPRGWIPRSQATIGNGGMPGVDQRTDLAPISSSNGGPDAAAVDAVSLGRPPG
jgi:hypothetical protein